MHTTTRAIGPAPKQVAGAAELSFHPLTAERWVDLEALFGPRGACAGCWCMWWRRTRTEWDRQRGDGNREAFRTLVASGIVPGILAYADGQPIGWCAIQPREAYPALERSRVLKPVDDQPVWSVTCFFVAKSHRRQGLTVRLLAEAVAYARERGAVLVEGYPVAPRKDRMPDVYAFTGTVSAFRRAGFREVARRSETRPIMRCDAGGARSAG
jgi:GNAT superfamily N-acetyltransferase